VYARFARHSQVASQGIGAVNLGYADMAMYYDYLHLHLLTSRILGEQVHPAWATHLADHAPQKSMHDTNSHCHYGKDTVQVVAAMSYPYRRTAKYLRA
jgi:hypothetical protein